MTAALPIDRGKPKVARMAYAILVHLNDQLSAVARKLGIVFHHRLRSHKGTSVRFVAA